VRRSVLSLLLALVLAGATASSAAAAQPPPQGEPMACGQEKTIIDDNGTFDLRFQCLPDQGVLNWGFRFNQRWRAMAISPVSERGLQYWRNGVEQRRNSDHVEAIDYVFHGTMSGVFVGEHVEYADFFVFRADFGGGQTGTARVTIAGSVILTP
jgi:hypothetical protein